jgi:hypothetical protein
MIITDWFDTTKDALLGVWHELINFIPNLVGAIIVFLIGWAIAVAVGKLVAEILKRLQFNKIFEKGTWKTALQRAEINVDASAFIGAIFKWILLIIFLIAAIQILGFNQLKSFFDSVLEYLPNVVVSAFIFVIAVIVADILEKIVRASVESFKVGYGYIVGIIVRWSIWVFAILAILQQLHIQAADWMVQFIQIAFMGLVAGLAIAFGLGGRDAAKSAIESMKNGLRK